MPLHGGSARFISLDANNPFLSLGGTAPDRALKDSQTFKTQQFSI
jgi:hypothetical protein